MIGFVRTADASDTAGSQDFAVDLAMEINERDHRWLNQVEQLTDRFDARGALFRSANDPDGKDFQLRDRIR